MMDFRASAKVTERNVTSPNATQALIVAKRDDKAMNQAYQQEEAKKYKVRARNLRHSAAIFIN